MPPFLYLIDSRKRALSRCATEAIDDRNAHPNVKNWRDCYSLCGCRFGFVQALEKACRIFYHSTDPAERNVIEDGAKTDQPLAGLGR